MLNGLDYTRQLSLIDVKNFTKPIRVIGAGATGSWLVMQLAKLGFQNVHIYDFDVIEEHNLPNQLFRIDQLGMNKAQACIDLAKDFGNVSYTAHDMRVDATTNLSGYVFVLTDTMASRKEIFEGALKFKPQVKSFIETRMGLQGYYIYTVNPMEHDQCEGYAKTLFKDEEGSVSACGSSQSVGVTASACASMALCQMLNVELGQHYEQEFKFSWGGNMLMTRQLGE